MSRDTEPKPTDAGEVDVAEELAVLFPDVDCTVRDPDTGEPVKLTVRKYRFLEGLEMQVLARPLIAVLADLIGEAERRAHPCPGSRRRCGHRASRGCLAHAARTGDRA